LHFVRKGLLGDETPYRPRGIAGGEVEVVVLQELQVVAQVGRHRLREPADCLGSQDALYDLINAADYLRIDGLLDAACKKLAGMMKGKTPEEIRNTFNIPDDYTEEEKKKVRRDYAWAFFIPKDPDEDEDSDEEEEGEP
jgi:hypothetical protein